MRFCLHWLSHASVNAMGTNYAIRNIDFPVGKY